MANVKDKKISDMSFKEIANLYGYKPQKYIDFCKTPEAEEYALDEEDEKYYNITDNNIEQVLETIGEEVKGLSKNEFNDEENSYYENLYKKSIELIM